ncbi:hypothetical protein [Roseibium sediminis]|uniref:hypothetical protein n=1 Tax=Roseibium sediminis TaxID=1775174 RepID=UPI00123CEDF1|nr:hypothetical protein [Roseibium sediminis]
MSTFGDIATGYDRLAGAANYGLVYTCNCGWLDLGHLNPTNNDPLIGAANLWTQIQSEGPDARTHWGYFYPPNFRQYDYPDTVLRDMRRDGTARFADGSTGYRVTYRQQMGPGLGTTGAFLVRRGLSEIEQKSVALSIFLIVSFRFETFQRGLEWGGIANTLSELIRGKAYDSGFSQEDLVSNLIGFYVGVGEISKRDAISACHPVSEDTAVAIWNREGPVGQNKNTTAIPQLPADTSADTSNMCVDECTGQTRSLPSVFRSIRPQDPGRNYIPLRE